MFMQQRQMEKMVGHTLEKCMVQHTRIRLESSFMTQRGFGCSEVRILVMNRTTLLIPVWKVRLWDISLTKILARILQSETNAWLVLVVKLQLRTTH